mmetsp:Transcript_81507/g.215020  ORF Transcript_81507/g.215020 Transcript_81507/m.215020 type:complete len:232 (-) Transcript_81507:1051-1746(-)
MDSPPMRANKDWSFASSVSQPSKPLTKVTNSDLLTLPSSSLSAALNKSSIFNSFAAMCFLINSTKLACNFSSSFAACFALNSATIRSAKVTSDNFEVKRRPLSSTLLPSMRARGCNVASAPWMSLETSWQMLPIFSLRLLKTSWRSSTSSARSESDGGSSAVILPCKPVEDSRVFVTSASSSPIFSKNLSSSACKAFFSSSNSAIRFLRSSTLLREASSSRATPTQIFNCW